MPEITSEEREKTELREILFQAENLQHNRVYYFLVAETIFFLAAGTALATPFVLKALSIAGIAIALLFTIINLKNYFRILWLSARLERVDPLYREYLHFHSFSSFVTLGPVSKRFFSRFIAFSEANSTTTPNPPNDSSMSIFLPGTQRWHHTGMLFTYGLFTIVVVSWLALLYFACFVWTPPATS